MIEYGLIGYPLSHSWSGEWFAEKFRLEGNKDRTYRLFPIQDLEEFTGIIRGNPDLRGLNVTIPYKESIIPFLDELDKSASEVGAVNTIVIIKQGNKSFLKGYNTDIDGFRLSADFQRHSNALILGTGGASKAVSYALGCLGIRYLLVSRHPEKQNEIDYSVLSRDIIQENTLIINTTPLGMHPDIHTCPKIPYQYLTSEHFLYDLVYNPAETLFLKKGKERGAKVRNGLKMLYIQAEKSYEIWNNPG